MQKNWPPWILNTQCYLSIRPPGSFYMVQIFCLLLCLAIILIFSFLSLLIHFAISHLSADLNNRYGVKSQVWYFETTVDKILKKSKKLSIAFTFFRLHFILSFADTNPKRMKRYVVRFWWKEEIRLIEQYKIKISLQ